jgi:hypothetical protein
MPAMDAATTTDGVRRLPDHFWIPASANVGNPDPGFAMARVVSLSWLIGRCFGNHRHRCGSGKGHLVPVARFLSRWREAGGLEMKGGRGLFADFQPPEEACGVFGGGGEIEGMDERIPIRDRLSELVGFGGTVAEDEIRGRLDFE